ncbi:ABC transporter ATP-binding protein [Desulfosarcina ovata]|uniref:Nickel import system ATP-binding protein NikD n=1 Tax=Desulfosarcina ovata subsp. ovata TaxID=2752305 RepID=A0A5K8A9A6_9BACT|nr:ABC transporter ATP-binding protein [Desulfosarcina ovata]BBO89145.1 ABC transporter ATP-binding protein [Desulfosarcina ovata subsp. ovata]
MRLIDIQNLETRFDTENGPVAAVNGVSLSVDRGCRHAVIGQSGAGKSILALSILRLLPDNARIRGEVFFKGRELLSCSMEAMREIRGKAIMMIFQNPLATLNPVLDLGTQLCEIPMCHEGVTYAQARQRALEALTLCELPDPERVMQSYPFQLSGGMLQRVAIAMGIICRPDLLIADEPFKGLDARLQQQVGATLYRICQTFSITLLLITHNLKIAHSLCDRVSVMVGGRIVETAATESFFACPDHAYSKRLVEAYDLFSSAIESAPERRCAP